MTISNEAVEAAVEAWDHHWGDRYGDEALEEMGDEVRVALEAAAPFIRAEAIRATAEEMRAERHSWCLDDAGRYWIKRTLDELAERGEG